MLLKGRIYREPVVTGLFKLSPEQGRSVKGGAERPDQLGNKRLSLFKAVEQAHGSRIHPGGNEVQK